MTEWTAVPSISFNALKIATFLPIGVCACDSTSEAASAWLRDPVAWPSAPYNHKQMQAGTASQYYFQEV